MNRYLATKVLLPNFAAIILSACAPSTQTVTFHIPIPSGGFSPQASIRVVVWNAEQRALSDRTADCAISHDAQTGMDKVDCPPGVIYEEPQPEEFMFPPGTWGAELMVRSTTVHAGEDYAVLISGLSPDNCNQASARAEGRARSADVTLSDLSWAVTEMGCP